MKSYYVKHRSGNRGGKILAVVMILCLGAAFITMMRNEQPGFLNDLYSDVCFHLGISTGRTYDESSVPQSVVTIPEENHSAYDFSLCYLYSQLGDFDKQVYEIFYDMIMHKDVEGYSRSMTIPAEDFELRTNDMYLVYYFMIRDNPELFYLDATYDPRVELSGRILGSSARVDFTLNPGIDNENFMIDKFEDSADRFMEDIDLTVSDAEIELQIHDKLIDLVSYDYDVLDDDGDKVGEHAYTAYGALVEDAHGRSNCAVCAGYAKAFQYLLKKAGIMSAQVLGVGGAYIGGEPYEGSHEWNLVLLDGEWYETDCTWDDPNFERYGLDEETIEYLEVLGDSYFASTHYWYNRTTDEMSYLPDVQEYTLEYSTGVGISLLPMCLESYHVREMDSSDYGYESFEYTNNMLPVAEGTKYGLGL